MHTLIRRCGGALRFLGRTTACDQVSACPEQARRGRAFGVNQCVIFLLLLACRQSPSPDPQVADPIANQPPTALPVLQEVSLSIPREDLPLHSPRSIAVSSSGVVAYPIEVDGPNFLRIVRPGHPIPVRWGTPGEGPGELLGGGDLFSFGTNFAYLSPERRQVVLFDDRGRVIKDLRSSLSYLVIASNDKYVLMNGEFTVRESAFLEVRDVGDLRKSRVVVPVGDTTLQRFAGLSRRSGRWPVAAINGDRIVIGDGYTYSLALFDATGSVRPFSRVLPPRTRTRWELGQTEDRLRSRAEFLVRSTDPAQVGRVLDSLKLKASRDTLPHFVPGGLGFDGAGRLWVLGQADDQTFADVFADTMFLGRTVIECRMPDTFRAISIRESWIAMICGTEDEEFPYNLRLFHIEDHVPPT